jgi:hypothetical protein
VQFTYSIDFHLPSRVLEGRGEGGGQHLVVHGSVKSNQKVTPSRHPHNFLTKCLTEPQTCDYVPICVKTVNVAPGVRVPTVFPRNVAV